MYSARQAGRRPGEYAVAKEAGDSRNGTCAKTALTETEG